MSLDTNMELSIKYEFVYPIIDHKSNYISLLKSDDNVHRYVTNSDKYHYKAIFMATTIELDDTVKIKIDKATDWTEIHDYYVDIEDVYYPQIIPLVSFIDCDIMNKILQKKNYQNHIYQNIFLNIIKMV